MTNFASRPLRAVSTMADPSNPSNNGLRRLREEVGPDSVIINSDGGGLMFGSPSRPTPAQRQRTGELHERSATENAANINAAVHHVLQNMVRRIRVRRVRDD
jgi:hypothetical protein